MLRPYDTIAAIENQVALILHVLPTPALAQPAPAGSACAGAAGLAAQRAAGDIALARRARMLARHSARRRQVGGLGVLGAAGSGGSGQSRGRHTAALRLQRAVAPGSACSWSSPARH